MFTAVPTKPSPRRFSMLAAGDVLSHVGDPAGERRCRWSRVRLRSDVRGRSAHHRGRRRGDLPLVTPVAPPGTEPDGVYPTYGVPADGRRAPHGWLRPLLVGVEPHHGQRRRRNRRHARCVRRRRPHAGMGARASRSGTGDLRRERVRVARHLRHAGLQRAAHPERETWRSNLIDPARIIAEAQQARAAGAEVVIVSLHWGAEGVSDVTAECVLSRTP